MHHILREIPLFRDLTDDDLELVTAYLQRISYAKGQTIFRQGDIGDAMYLVESGQVVVWDETADKALAYLGHGSFVGEIALLLAEPRSASLKVAIDADLFVLEKAAFDRLLKERPAIAIHMTRELGQRLVSTSQQHFKTRNRQISALCGRDGGELVKHLQTYLDKAVAIVPLPGAEIDPALTEMDEVMVLTDLEISIETLAAQLAVQVDVFAHVVLLLPPTPSDVSLRALTLADTIISIGSPPQWVRERAPGNKVWETTNDPIRLQRLARRLTGHAVGLVLSPGSAKGLAHIGVIKALRAANIPIDMIAGSSIGSLFGAFLAAGWGDEQFEAFADETEKIVKRWMNWDINLPPRAGIIKGGRVREMIARWLGNRDFDDLEIPFYCVAADIISGQEVVFGCDTLEKASLVDAVRASISLPILFNPWQINGRYLADGALVNPLPAAMLRDRGADIIIASNVIEALDRERGIARPEKMPHFLKIINNIVTLSAHELSKSQLDKVDVLIHSKVSVDHALDVGQAHKMIEVGEQTAQAQIPAIKTLLEHNPAEISQHPQPILS